MKEKTTPAPYETTLSKEQERKKMLLSYLMITLGSIIYGFGFNWFFTANKLAYGGVTGMILIFDYVIGGLPVGTLMILCNIPIFLLGWKHFGKTMLYRSLYSMVTMSIAVDVVAYSFTFEPMDEILASIYGGAVLGVALGLTMLQRASTGGTDLLSRVIRLKMGWLPVGRIILAMDLVVISITAIVTHNINSALYGLIAMYVTTLIMDHMMYGVDRAQVAYIISNKQDEVVAALTNKLNRGVTIIPSTGGWSGESRPMIMCAFRHRQIVTVKSLIQETDPDAFFISCPAHEVLGRGFKQS